MKTWVLIIFLWSDVRPIAVATNIPGYLTIDECRLAAGMLILPTPSRVQMVTACIYGPPLPRGLF